MQRIISLQTSRNADRESSEFVTKRLCCSFLFSVAFLSLLGGFLLGRFAADKAVYLKQANLQRLQQKEEKHSINTLNLIVKNINVLYNLTTIENANLNYQLLGDKINCTRFFVRQNLDEDLQHHLAFKMQRVVTAHLDALNDCFADLVAYFNTTRVVHE